mmetsp:Transcript_47709/g.137376  ORF Transcript_47709/g.137376 Transcript_47709/m.137376 type:complete len:248 (+) Transcript_47709:646-1389(+)
MAAPSKVDVPRPSSSSTAKDRGVPCAKMLDVSSSSVRSVLLPSMIVSYDPIRVKTRSIGLKRHFSAFTRQPSCAMMTAMQVCRSTVDLPPMLGPVTTRTCGTLQALMNVSFGTKAAPIFAAATGWRQLRSSSVACACGSAVSTNSAQHADPVSSLDAAANDKSASTSAKHRTAARNCAWYPWNCRNKWAKNGKMQSSRLSSRLCNFSINSLMLAVWNRTFALFLNVSCTPFKKDCGKALASHSTSYR